MPVGWGNEDVDSDIMKALCELEIFPDTGGDNDSERGRSDDNPSDACCPNCGNDEWGIDARRGDYVCDCGYCEAGVAFAQTGKSDRRHDMGRDFQCHDEEPRYISAGQMGLGGGGGASSKRYRHSEYYSRRIRDWAMHGPAIPADDWESILCTFLDWARRKGIEACIPTTQALDESVGRIAGTALLSKGDIYSILAETDSKCDEAESPRFRRLYFSQWLTIRYRLSGVKSSFYNCPTWLLEAMDELFPKILTYFQRFIYSRGTRVTFMPYSFVISRMLDLYGYSNLTTDFPSLKSKQRRGVLNTIWRKLCLYYHWPYINSENE